MRRKKTAGIYIHIPFCRIKCGYCDFYSITNLNIIDKFLVSLLREIEFYKYQFSDFIYDTIYFGGGTPSVLSEKQLEKILNTLNKYFHIDKKNEITIEVNPEDIIEKPNYLKNLKLLGFNRISYGLQSLKKKHLQFLNRYDNINKLKYGLEETIKHFGNINVDLIHSVLNMQIKDISDTLKYLINIGIPHISTYSLIYEEETPLYIQVEKKKIKPADSNEEYRQYKFIKELLENYQYIHYEISNFAKRGYESKHNLKYWEFENYLGLGPSAHSMMNLIRWNNFRNIISYNVYLKSGKLPIEKKFELTLKDIETEIIYLGIRSSGVDLEKFKRYTGLEFKEKYKDSINFLIRNGYAKFVNDKFKLINDGLFLADEIMIKYF